MLVRTLFLVLTTPIARTPVAVGGGEGRIRHLLQRVGSSAPPAISLKPLISRSRSRLSTAVELDDGSLRSRASELHLSVSE